MDLIRTGNVVEGDDIYGNGTGQQWNAGVHILNSPDTTVCGSTIDDNLGRGIVLTGHSGGSTITGKTLPKNTVLDNELGAIAY